MTFGSVVLVLALGAMFVTSFFLVFCRRYEEGLGGNLALGGLAIGCGVLLWDALTGTLQPPAPPWCAVIVCVAYLLARHAYRFAMFHWHGQFGWTKPRDHDQDATVPLGIGAQR